MNFTDSSHSRGVCIMFDETLDVELINRHCREDGSFLLLNVKIYDQIFCLVNVYAPNTEKARKDLSIKVKKWIVQFGLTNVNVILGGDLNTCLRDINRCPQTHLKDTSRIKLNDVITDLNLRDIWASKNKVQGFTYTDKHHKTRSRLEYWFTTNKVLEMNYNSKIIPS